MSDVLDAVQITSPIDYHLNPFFDIDTWWSVPLWAWMIAFVVGVFIFVLIKWLRRRAIMGPVMDYLPAKKGGRRRRKR